jgi:heptosyltransferase-2
VRPRVNAVNIALLQINPLVGDVTGNRRLIADAVREAGRQGVDLAITPELAPELRESGAQQLVGVGWDGREPLMAIAPGAAYGGSKQWPPQYFAELVMSLSKDGVRSVMVGSRADLPVGREIGRVIEASRGVPLFNLMGTDLPTLAAVLANCRAVVANDSGALHLAAALGLRVTAVYGPTDERLTHPLGDEHAVLTNPVWCRPCWLRECPIDHRCMRGIGVDRVVGAVRQML